MLKRIATTHAPTAVVLVRLMVGAVFLSEGIQKFLFQLKWALAFAKIGFESPEFVAQFVACFEIACGVLVLLGLMTRLAVIPLIVIMLTAIYTTKFEIFQQQGFWKMAHEARTDWSILLGSLFLLIVGAGQWSIDAWLSRSRSPQFVPQHALRPLQRETSWHRPRRGACASRHLCCPLRQRRRDYSPLFIGTRLASSHLFSRRRPSEPLICGPKVLILLCTSGGCDRAFCIALLFTTISHQGVPK